MAIPGGKEWRGQGEGKGNAVHETRSKCAFRKKTFFIHLNKRI